MIQRDQPSYDAGRHLMAAVYGWTDAPDVPGDFFTLTAQHLFGEIWTRPGLSMRDRRLLLIGLLVGLGERDVIGVQIDGALANRELTADDLREIVIFLTHYAGWPRGAALNTQVEQALSR